MKCIPSHSEISPISAHPRPTRIIQPRLVLSAVCLFASAILIVAAVLPTSIWRDTIVGSTSWSILDDRDLKYMRVVFGGFGLIFLLWSFVFPWTIYLKHRLSDRIGNGIYRAILLVLILSMGYFLARVFIVFRDSVRITGPKTPFSNWGEFLGKIWTVPFQPFTERDYFNSLFLAFAGFICSFMVVLRHKGLVRVRELDFPRLLWGVLAAGFLWASVDELVMIHEFLGPNLPFLRSTHITKYPDDLIMLGYFVAGAVVLVRYFKYFITRKSAFSIFVMGMIFQGMAAANGLPGLNLNEESFEMYGGLCYFVAMFWYAYCEIEESLSHYHDLPRRSSATKPSTHS